MKRIYCTAVLLLVFGVAVLSTAGAAQQVVPFSALTEVASMEQADGMPLYVWDGSKFVVRRISVGNFMLDLVLGQSQITGLPAALAGKVDMTETDAVTITNVANQFGGTFTGDGSGLTGITQGQVAGLQASLEGATNAAGRLVPNSVFVDGVTGNDTTGDGTLGRPYATLTKGQTEAVSGQTVVVLQGTFIEGNLGKPGVGWYFNAGTAVTNTVIFRVDSTNGTNLVVRGKGNFYPLQSFTGTLLRVQATNAVVDFSAGIITNQSGHFVTFEAADNNNVVKISADYIKGRMFYGADGLTNVSRVYLSTTTGGDIEIWDMSTFTWTNASASMATNRVIECWPGRTLIVGNIQSAGDEYGLVVNGGSVYAPSGETGDVTRLRLNGTRVGSMADLGMFDPITTHVRGTWWVESP